MFQNDEEIFKNLSTCERQINLYRLTQEQYLAFIYASLNLKIDGFDLQLIINNHLDLYKADPTNSNYKHYLEEVYRRSGKTLILNTQNNVFLNIFSSR